MQAFDELGSPEALALLARAPSPEQGRALSTNAIRSTLRRAGRQRQLDARAVAIREALRGPQLAAAPTVAAAFAASVRAHVAVAQELTRQIAALEGELAESFQRHPDAEILRSLPGLGLILGARVLGEFGDDPNRYQNAKRRRCYAATAPITRASGTRRVVVARHIHNDRLIDACNAWAFSALRASPGARAYYDARRTRGASHHQALRALANRLVGLLHGCLRHRTHYDEQLAWRHQPAAAP